MYTVTFISLCWPVDVNRHIYIDLYIALYFQKLGRTCEAIKLSDTAAVFSYSLF